MVSGLAASAPRSYLYVPGDRADRLAGAVARGADAVIADLEDAVAAAAKESARETVGRWLASRPGEGGCEIWVRINADAIEPDLEAVFGPLAAGGAGAAGAGAGRAGAAGVAATAIDGVVVPKAEPELLALVDEELTRHERRLGLEPRSVGVLALVESARGLLDVATSARMPRVRRLGIGEADLIGELGLRPGPGREELAPLRLQVVLASAAAGILAPVAPTSTDFRDLQAFRATSQALLALGFRARTAVHPGQLAVIHDVFTPTEDEVAAARELVETYEQAGSGVAVDARGRMIDAAVVRSAREVLSRART